MSNKTRTVLVRFGRVLLYGTIGVLIAALPDAFANIPQEYQFIAAPILVAIIAALDKARRYGTDPGEH